MLKSYEAIYDHGQIRWLETPPDVDEARVIVTVLPAQVAETTAAPRRRRPPEKLKGSITIAGNIVSSPYSDAEWEAMCERTARQLEGDHEAFK
jgi:hypothetical protein